MVKAPGCGPGDRGFKSHHPPHIRVYMSKKIYFLIIPIICLGLSCFGDNENLKSSSDFSNGPDRYFRLFEASDFGNQVFYFEKTLPPYLSYLLNLSSFDGREEPIALPVHPEGELLASYHVLKQDGSHVVWLIFDTAAAALSVEEDIQKQLNISPWQLDGGQSSNTFSVVSFRNTENPNITGLVTIQAFPPDLKIDMEILRAGKSISVELPRGSIEPFPTFTYIEEENSIVIKESQYHSSLIAGDIITSIEGNLIGSVADLDDAMASLDEVTDAKSSIMYRLNIDSDNEFDVKLSEESISRPIPKKFPAKFLFLEGAIVTDINWSIDQGTANFQSSLHSDETVSAITDLYRDLLNTQGWELVEDMSRGSSSLLGFQNSTLGYSGILSIERDLGMKNLTRVSIRIESNN